ncbi:MAG TPA: transketolase [Acidobacteriaceae bacterium]|jgi:transketolase|nr:transketolase [Acidobacteriaceae bacterium]
MEISGARAGQAGGGGPERGARLKHLANRIRLTAMAMTHHAQLGHTGGDLSSADVLAVLFGGGVLRVRAEEPWFAQRDRFILSKGHCAAALYATLAFHGFFPEERLRTFMDPMSPLNGHPDRNKVPGVEANTGPLGHGLPIAVGCALAARMRGEAWRTFVLTGDGELQEGSNWEAAMSASHYELDQLVVIVDRNRIQQGDWTEKTIRLDPLAEKWRAFGFAVEEIDGHDTSALEAIFARVPLVTGKPTCIVANTIKGKGVSFAENQPQWHHGVPTAEELKQAAVELGVEMPW